MAALLYLASNLTELPDPSNVLIFLVCSSDPIAVFVLHLQEEEEEEEEVLSCGFSQCATFIVIQIWESSGRDELLDSRV